MSTSALLERMRKLREERERAAAAASASAMTNSTQPPTTTLPSAQSALSSTSPPSQSAPADGSSTRDGRSESGVQPSLQSSQVNSTNMATSTTRAGCSSAIPRGQDFLLNTPPSFMSPASVQPRYRDAGRDALCAPFTAEIAVQLYLCCANRGLAMTSIDPGIRHTDADTDTTNSGTSAHAIPEFANPEVLANDKQAALAVNHFAPATQCTREHPLAPTSEERNAYRQSSCNNNDSKESNSAQQHDEQVGDLGEMSKSLLGDVAYLRGCGCARVDTGTRVRQPCRDVNLYTRRDRIAHGVYGVVFSATRTVPTAPSSTSTARHGSSDENDSTQHGGSHSRNSGRGGATNTSSTPNCRGSSSSHNVMLYALKHIKKQWLSESQVGFPPYLLREFDLLLRLHHPNIVEAKELVLLDPVQPTCDDVSDKETAKQSMTSANAHSGAHNNNNCTVSNSNSKFSSNSIGGESEVNASSRNMAEEARNTRHISTSCSSSVAAKALAAVGTTSKVKDVFLVMEYCCHDLKSYMLRCCRDTLAPYFHLSRRNTHPHASTHFLARAKCIMYQLLSGLSFLHNHRILHRDIKTSNILLNHQGYVKLADFGLGRLYREGQSLTPTVVTLMYRAPELHLGVTDYSHTMDVWSVGCVFAELFLKQPLFRASTDATHMLAVCDVLGIPTEESFPGMYHLPAAREVMRGLHRWNRHDRLHEIFPPHNSSTSGNTISSDVAHLPESGLALLRAMLRWNPSERIGAAEALRHPFFHEYPLPCAPQELMRPMPFSTELSSCSVTSVAATATTKTTRMEAADRANTTFINAATARSTTAASESKAEASKPTTFSSQEVAVPAVTPVPVCMVDIAPLHGHGELCAHEKCAPSTNEKKHHTDAEQNVHCGEERSGSCTRKRHRQECGMTFGDSSLSPSAQDVEQSSWTHRSRARHAKMQRPAAMRDNKDNANNDGGSMSDVDAIVISSTSDSDREDKEDGGEVGEAARVARQAQLRANQDLDEEDQ